MCSLWSQGKGLRLDPKSAKAPPPPRVLAGERWQLAHCLVLSSEPQKEISTWPFGH